MKFDRAFLSLVFGVELFFFAVLSLLELLLPGLATNFLPMPALALAVIILGLVVAFRPPSRSAKSVVGHALPTAALTVLTLPLVWLTLAPFGALASLAAVSAAVAAGISIHILLTTKD